MVSSVQIIYNIGIFTSYLPEIKIEINCVNAARQKKKVSVLYWRLNYFIIVILYDGKTSQIMGNTTFATACLVW